MPFYKTWNKKKQPFFFSWNFAWYGEQTAISYQILSQGAVKMFKMSSIYKGDDNGNIIKQTGFTWVFWVSHHHLISNVSSLWFRDGTHYHSKILQDLKKKKKTWNLGKPFKNWLQRRKIAGIQYSRNHFEPNNSYSDILDFAYQIFCSLWLLSMPFYEKDNI